MKEIYEKIKSVVIGHAVADALGVPVEFRGRTELAKAPVTDMRGFGTYSVPAGSWSDDTSMSLAALDSLANGRLDYTEIMENFAKWYFSADYTPTGAVFDIGGTCLDAIYNYSHNTGIAPTECGSDGDYSNGNGSLMRIHPFSLAMYYGKNSEKDW
ncbi:MAG: ADP-ribosylglycohydrolase family protein, partial [Clostridia bacterium]|nr:ADP-ribosylglycohydrolase family protein [Clostridia bacterium]